MYDAITNQDERSKPSKVGQFNWAEHSADDSCQTNRQLAVDISAPNFFKQTKLTTPSVLTKWPSH